MARSSYPLSLPFGPWLDDPFFLETLISHVLYGESKLHERFSRAHACILPLHAANRPASFTYFMRRERRGGRHALFSACRCMQRGLDRWMVIWIQQTMKMMMRAERRSVPRADLERLNPIIGAEFRRSTQKLLLVGRARHKTCHPVYTKK